MSRPTGTTKQKVVDVHTHMYPPEYISLLKSRSSIPMVRTFSNAPEPRLILLNAEVDLVAAMESGSSSTLPGRPLTSHYSDLAQKIHFMDTHGIDISVISLANPWLDFVPSADAIPIATSIAKEFDDMCSSHPGRLFFFAALPLTAPLDSLNAWVPQLKKAKYCRGVILGTSGLGKGLDDPELLPVFEALETAGLMIFLHPHYGLPNEVWGPRATSNNEYGHVLPLALGFPMETTIAVTRMYLAGVFDRFKSLRMLLAHSGGTLPFLAGRIESCILHDGHLVKEGKVGPSRRTIWEVLKEQIYLDAVIYSEVGLKTALQASGADRLMFGTDHPFFPPLTSDEQGEWESVGLNAEAVTRALGSGTQEEAAVMGGNAVQVVRSPLGRSGVGSTVRWGRHDEENAVAVFHTRLQGNKVSAHLRISSANLVVTHSQGGEDTFGHNYQFTEDLRQRLSIALPKIDIRVVVYPKFETRGDLADCVSRFRDWLLEKVIDIEVEAQTPSPTVDPSVRTILVGHSMGGIVAAETVIALTSDKPIPPPSSTDPDASTTGAPADSASASLNSLMFPYIQGVLAFDTPYLGISPGVVAHGAEGHYTKASEALTQLSGLTGALWGGSAGAASSSSSSSRQQQGGAARKEPVAALPAPPPPQQQQQVNDQQQKQAGGGGGGGGWGSWGKIAMYAGAGAALAGGAAAAYLKRDQITEGWTWAASHLEFVGCLARGEELRRRTAYMVRANRELGLGFANLYTRLGRAAPPRQVSMVGTVMGSQRTFCNLPSRQAAGDWREAVNDAASDETWAHMSMFDPKENPGYERLADEARDLIASWARNDWYEASSEEEKPRILA